MNRKSLFNVRGATYGVVGALGSVFMILMILLVTGAMAILLSILATIPAQVLAYKLVQAQGDEPGTTRHMTKVIPAEEGISNTT